MERFMLPASVARNGLAVVSIASAVFAAAISTGGHASLDSIQQLYEALVGRSVSWNPPFMSALFRILGVGPDSGAGISMAIFVAMICLAFWGGIILAARAGKSDSVMNPLLWLLLAVLCINPLLLVYAGIVWKDVLFAALLSFSSALLLLAGSSKNPSGRLIVAFFAAVLVGTLPLVRQQGYVLAPLLSILLLLLVWWTPAVGYKLRQALMAFYFLLILGVYLAGNSWAQAVIPGNEGRATSVGFRLIATFDLLGIEAHGGRMLSAIGANDRVLHEIREHYTPQRIDFLGDCPDARAFLDGRPDVLSFGFWMRSVIDNPSSYFAHRLSVLKYLFGIEPPSGCLPVHLGIDGFPYQIEALGLGQGTDVADRQLYQWLKPLFDSVFFRHVSYLGGFVLLAILVAFHRRGRSRIMLLMLIGAGLAFYASFVPTAIACDVRYLFPAVPLLTVLAIAFSFGWREASDGDV
ncbi:hypothetical protein [Silanimonas lenta]|uniref:hypothetical protein n=1 Tax=Silanimonas lenta TaxID=265429 RepID=UPI002FE3FA16